MRTAEVVRNTKETQIRVRLNLDGKGAAKLSTGIPFLEHMLEQLARHGMLDLEVEAKGDLHIDAHHTVEDIGITLGQAFARAVGDKAGVRRFGHAYVPLDEALSRAVVDFSGRPGLEYHVAFKRALIGEYEETVAALLQGLTRDNHALAIEIAALPESIRGYGHIKAKSAAAARAKRDEFIFAPLSKRDIMGLVARARAVVDIERVVQTGYTMRSIETMGAGRKIISTNARLAEADFYHENNVAVIDRSKPRVEPGFLESPFVMPKRQVWKKYTLSSWLDDVLHQ